MTPIENSLTVMNPIESSFKFLRMISSNCHQYKQLKFYAGQISTNGPFEPI